MVQSNRDKILFIHENKELKIEFSTNPNKNASTLRKILESLPLWFGIEEAIDEYVERSKKQLTLIANINKESVGFLSVTNLNTKTIEIDSMAVLATYHHQNIGTELLKILIKYCQDQNISKILVKTLDESHPSKEYNFTRKFYYKIGFEKIKVSSIWSKSNPCLEMKLLIQ